jgi:hypothetical protein
MLGVLRHAPLRMTEQTIEGRDGLFRPQGQRLMSTDPSLVISGGIFLAIAVLAVVVIIIKLTGRRDDVLHGGYIKREEDND